ncbi:hypothetical protein K505DRAFT_360056 [Melanomma pulvis-pyrius CBS 109.77]|uniref:Ig-like domain-containing protein n=1 Tax=Melanomma pulvis-pyrius CBS 109.77 TaxID=1314802 RepID=A0A6A6XGW0_9PLEO|nr:hypothetical protein K505DRAFT_360056 [Melanomma pulvis-pyrius CBS 109.77]
MSTLAIWLAGLPSPGGALHFPQRTGITAPWEPSMRGVQTAGRRQRPARGAGRTRRDVGGGGGGSRVARNDGQRHVMRLQQSGLDQQEPARNLGGLCLVGGRRRIAPMGPIVPWCHLWLSQPQQQQHRPQASRNSGTASSTKQVGVLYPARAAMVTSSIPRLSSIPHPADRGPPLRPIRPLCADTARTLSLSSARGDGEQLDDDEAAPERALGLDASASGLLAEGLSGRRGSLESFSFSSRCMGEARRAPPAVRGQFMLCARPKRVLFCFHCAVVAEAVAVRWYLSARADKGRRAIAIPLHRSDKEMIALPFLRTQNLASEERTGGKAVFWPMACGPIRAAHGLRAPRHPYATSAREAITIQQWSTTHAKGDWMRTSRVAAPGVVADRHVRGRFAMTASHSSVHAPFIGQESEQLFVVQRGPPSRPHQKPFPRIINAGLVDICTPVMTLATWRPVDPAGV